MLKVFLVEDETIIREGLRDNIPWEQYGYTLVGEAGDGEQALPMILQLKPDILITDIRMPFMDGLALSQAVIRELPGIKVIIISGHDDFEYARQAIRVGVEQYLLKPITKAMLLKTLQEINEKILKERKQENYIEKFKNEMQEYEEFSRRQLFEEIVLGRGTKEEIQAKAKKHNLSINGPYYITILYILQEKKSDFQRENGPIEQLKENLTRFFIKYHKCLHVSLNMTTYAVLINGEEEQVQLYLEKSVGAIQSMLAAYDAEIDWHLSIGNMVGDVKLLEQDYKETNRILSYRHLHPKQHMLTIENTKNLYGDEDENKIKNLDMSKIDPGILRGFLENGRKEEIENFSKEYIRSLADAAKSKLFCQYLMLSVRFTALAYLEELGISQEEFLKNLECVKYIGMAVNAEQLLVYIQEMLECVIELRDKESKNQYRNMISKAVKYIDKYYTSESLSLKEVAGVIDVSANYFSAVFSQEMGQTFIEYLTWKRMEKAKALLEATDKKTAEIATAVGYKDSHYFSFVFRKTQGCTPRDYRGIKR